ncbi:phage portal protein [Halorubellus sp. JP-L1]|uniref:phage portal protein n=1 Tax=Halorubellus sp. JP-L1 TaxID=2715753 RepID=UPI00140B74C5|nr:phage portal protein [Halorubellus sp. JP-L1]NHN40547.1 phage portal protein [Halorubellus sp. JP-L1]
MTDDIETGAYSEGSYRSITKDVAAKAEETQQLDDKYKEKIRGGAIQPPFYPPQMARLLEINPTHAKCCFSKSRNVAGYGLEIVPHPDVDEPDESQRQIAEDFWHNEDSTWQVGPVDSERSTPADVLEMAWTDYEAIGWLSIELLTSTDGTPTGLAWVPAMTIRRRRDKPGYVQLRRNRLQYFGNAGDRYESPGAFVDSETGESGRSVANPANELIFKRNHSPLYTHYGAPDIVPAIPTVQGDDAAREFNIDFFENNAVPRMAVIVEGGELTEGARKDIHDLLHGMKEEDHRTVVLEAEKLLEDTGQIRMDEDADDLKIRVEPLTVGINEDASFQEFRDRNEHEILKTHDVPPIEAGQIKSGAFSTDAEAQRKGYIETVIQPKQDQFAQLLYETVHDALGVTDYTIEFQTRGVDSRLTDANVAQTRIAAARGAMTVNEARAELDLEPLDDEEMGETLLANIEDTSTDPRRDPNRAKSLEAVTPPESNSLGKRTDVTLKGQVETMQFDSSNLRAGLYDRSSNDLYIKFRRDEGMDPIYIYRFVTPSTWEELKDATSHGSYHYHNIRMAYPYERIGMGEWPQTGRAAPSENATVRRFIET